MPRVLPGLQGFDCGSVPAPEGAMMRTPGYDRRIASLAGHCVHGSPGYENIIGKGCFPYAGPVSCRARRTGLRRPEPFMSMLSSLYRITAEQAETLEAFPGAVVDLLGTPSPPPKVGLLARLFGKPATSVVRTGPVFQPVGAADTFDLDQAWHVLHFLFSGRGAEGDLPAAFLMSGGRELGPDQGYGPARLLSPELSRSVAEFLARLSFQKLDVAYDPDAMEAAGIYWQASSEPAERQRQVEELWGIAKELRVFLERTAAAGGAILVTIY